MAKQVWYGSWTTVPDDWNDEQAEPEIRYVLCEHCGSEGRVLTMSGNDPDSERDHGPCPVCEGTGRMEVRVEPITMEDLP